MADNTSNARRRAVDGRQGVGIAFTVAWVGMIAIYFLSNVEKFEAMEPNAVGDFLAGAFGPVAFFWLVLGYLQQGDELQQNTEALRLQAQELKNSVEQQSELVRVAREQLDEDRRALRAEQERLERESRRQSEIAQPKLVFVNTGYSRDGANISFSLTISNTGSRACTGMTIRFQFGLDEYLPSWISIDRLESGLPHRTTMTIPRSMVPLTMMVPVEFYDGLGDPGEQMFKAVVSDTSIKLAPHRTPAPDGAL